MGFLAAIRAWRAARKERLIDERTNRASDLSDDKQYDILMLHERGVIRAKGTGQSITRVHADVENLIRKTLRVTIKPGTYFVARGGHQNMATTAEYSFTLYPCRTEHLSVDAACINAGLPIPTERDHFNGVAKVKPDVARFLDAAKAQGKMVIQAGVWTLTDNLSRWEVKARLVNRDRSGATWQAISDDDCDQAAAILDELGVKHRLWLSDVEFEKKREVYDNQDVYEGEFRFGKRHGRGRYTWPNGDFYEGEWRMGRKHGNGTFSWEGGYRYVGAFADGDEVGGWYHQPNGSVVWAWRGRNGKLQIGEPPSDGVKSNAVRYTDAPKPKTPLQDVMERLSRDHDFAVQTARRGGENLPVSWPTLTREERGQAAQHAERLLRNAVPDSSESYVPYDGGSLLPQSLLETVLTAMQR